MESPYPTPPKNRGLIYEDLLGKRIGVVTDALVTRGNSEVNSSWTLEGILDSETKTTIKLTDATSLQIMPRGSSEVYLSKDRLIAVYLKE